MNQWEKCLDQYISTISEEFGCHVCFHGNAWDMEYITPYHQNPFCPKIKKDYRLSAQCFQFDTFTVRTHLNMIKGPALKICPGGLLEAVFPVFVNNWPYGVFFIGPFSPDSPIPEDVDLIRSAKIIPIMSSLHLPVIQKKELQRLLVYGQMLAEYMGCLLATMPLVSNAFEAHVRRYVFHNCTTGNMSLSKLAEYIGVTPSHLSAKLRKEMNIGFSQLVNSERVKIAQKMLLNTMLTIKEIAKQCGFSDDRYFYRVFRQISGCTPSQFRHNFRNR